MKKNKFYLLAAPALLLVASVFVYPIVRALVQSFFDISLTTGLKAEYVGLQNFHRMFVDGRYWNTMMTTTVFAVVTLALELVIGLGIALILNAEFKGRGLLRGIAILPWALPTALIAMGWTWMFHDQFGLVNNTLSLIGFDAQGMNWLGHPVRAFIALVIADVWKTSAFIAILLLAGLQSISEDLYEAQALEGASPVYSFFTITLPLIGPHIGVALLFRFAQAFGIFELVQVMTGGGPAGSTETVAPYIHSVAMRYLDFGYAACLVITTFIVICASLAFITVLRRSLWHQE